LSPIVTTGRPIPGSERPVVAVCVVVLRVVVEEERDAGRAVVETVVVPPHPLRASELSRQSAPHRRDT
jgi:hypothetical protein